MFRVAGSGQRPASAPRRGPVAFVGLGALVFGSLTQAGRTRGGAGRAGRVVVAEAGRAPEQDDGDQPDQPFEQAEGAGQGGGLTTGAEVDRDHGGQSEQQGGDGAGPAFAPAGDP